MESKPTTRGIGKENGCLEALEIITASPSGPGSDRDSYICSISCSCAIASFSLAEAMFSSFASELVDKLTPFHVVELPPYSSSVNEAPVG